MPGQLRSRSPLQSGHGWRRLIVAAAALAALIAAGCGNPGPTVYDRATELLQRNRHQDAIDALAKETSPRAYWLRAIALDRLGQASDARDQIDKALAAEPKNVEYRGLSLRFQLTQLKMEAADEIIRLRDENRTSAALALFAFYGHFAKSVHLTALRQESEGRAEGSQAIMALNTAIALSADIPEFHRELLSIALKAQLGAGVDVLSEKLANLDPDDPEILSDRISVLTMIGRHDDAVTAAERLYVLKQRSEQGALVLSDALCRASWSDGHDQSFRELVEAFPKDISILTRYGVYLARSKRIRMAADAFDAAIGEAKDEPNRMALVDAMMSVVLEANAADVAQEQLDRYRKQIRDPLVVTYFEGRIRFLNKDYTGALVKMSEVLDAQKDAVATHRPLAADALAWTQIILADKNAAETLRQAAEALRNTAAGRAVLADDPPAEAEIPDLE